MGARETYDAIVNVLRILDSANLLYFSQTPVIENNNFYSQVTWPNHQKGASYNSEDAFGRILQFKGVLENGAYQAILKDGAFIKASYSYYRNKLTAHSLWYWPCPFHIEEEELEELPPIDLLDLYSSDWVEMVRFRSPLRFDFDKGNEEFDHPASHLHFQAYNCRVGVQRPISFATFIKFIFKNFYRDEWTKNFDIWDDLTVELKEEQDTHLTPIQMETPYVGWIKVS
jgi:hypothetical protein